LGSYSDTVFSPTQKEILAVCDTREEALRAEMFFHEFYDVAKNLKFANRAKQTSTRFSTEGTTSSEETRQKIGKSKIGKPRSKETKQKLRKANLGKVVSKETKEKIGCAMAGEKNPMFGKTGELSPNYGKPCSEETRRRIGEPQKGAKNHNYGKTQSEDAKRKQIEAQTGKKWWVNAAGETKFQFKSPGSKWQQGRKWKG
jgi:hypothetical protein